MSVQALQRDGEPEGPKRIAVIGLPNTGKSLIFGHLTGEYTIVANYPFTTVEISRSVCRMNGRACQVIDTPGLHCLSAHSEEELAVRNLVIHEQPDLILQCIDANRLKQSLTLTVDLLELGLPMVISLNAIDETTRKGIWIDSSALSRLLGVPVIETIATQGHGIGDLKKALANTRTPPCPLRYGDTIEEALSDMQDVLGGGMPHARKIALLMCMGDPFIEASVAHRTQAMDIAKLKARVKEVRLKFRGSIDASITATKSRWVDEVAEQIVKQQKVRPTQFGVTFGHLCRHPLFGIPIALAFLAATYQLVGQAAPVLTDALDAYIAVPIMTGIGKVIPGGFWHDLLLDQDYGLLPLGLFNAICTVLPVLFLFFIMFGFLEDIGYIPNLCVLAKRILDKVGLQGGAVLSLVLGFGCKTMATLTTRGLPRKEKIIAVYLIAATIPCSAQLGLTMALLGRYTFWAFALVLAIRVAIAIVAGLFLNRILPDTSTSDFIQELPPMRLPGPKAVLIKTGYRLYWFLREAVPVFLIAALVMFLSDRLGVLAVVRAGLHPIVVDWLGLPLATVDALLMTTARLEAGVGMLIRAADAGEFSAIQCLEAVLLTTLFVPCFANIVAMCKQVGIKTAVLMTGVMAVSAFALVSVLHGVVMVFG